MQCDLRILNGEKSNQTFWRGRSEERSRKPTERGPTSRTRRCSRGTGPCERVSHSVSLSSRLPGFHRAHYLGFRVGLRIPFKLAVWNFKGHVPVCVFLLRYHFVCVVFYRRQENSNTCVAVKRVFLEYDRKSDMDQAATECHERHEWPDTGQVSEGLLVGNSRFQNARTESDPGFEPAQEKAFSCIGKRPRTSHG